MQCTKFQEKVRQRNGERGRKIGKGGTRGGETHATVEEKEAENGGKGIQGKKVGEEEGTLQLPPGEIKRGKDKDNVVEGVESNVGHTSLGNVLVWTLEVDAIRMKYVLVHRYTKNKKIE